MTDGESEETTTPRDAQRAIIDSDDYPMRVLAGAGTGKTFTMVRKVERLIESGVPPDRILALTFTNKAADSMREKLVERVGPTGYDIEAYTYHAICHDLLAEFGYHANLNPRYDIATEADQLTIAFEVLDEVPYRFTNPDVYQDLDYATDAVDRLLQFVPAMKRSGIRPADLEAYLVPPARLIELEGIVDRIEEAVETHLRVGWQTMNADRVDDMIDRLGDFQAVLMEERSELSGDGFEADLGAYLSAMVDTAESLAAFLEANRDVIANGELEDAQKLPAHLFGSYSGAPSGMPDLSFDFADELRSFIEEVQAVSDLTAGYRAYEAALDEAGLQDFNDLVLETVDVLDDDQVHDWLTDRYEYVFCDEFQDTDQVQFELVRKLLPMDRLFVVGDDDQAIYEWRGANVENIGRHLDDTFSNLSDFTLEENFRSNQPILDLANAAITHVDTRGEDKVLEAVGAKADASTGVVTIEAAEELEDEAEQIRNAVTRLLTGDTDQVDGQYGPGDIAILVRKTRHAGPIINELRAAGIPYELGGDLASQSPGVETVIAALKAIANPADEVSLNRVLRMRYRLAEADLELLNTAEDVPGVEQFDEPSLQAALLGLPLQSFDEPERVRTARDQLGELWSKRDTLSLSRMYRELKSALRIEWFLSAQERRDLQALDEIVSSFDDGAVQAELSGEFIEHLARHGQIAEASDRSMEDQPETDRTAVQVMTVHKSKGLEFPVVILPQLQADQWEPNARTHDVIEHAIDGGQPTEVDFVKRDEQEARRLLHVAITRSEELVLLVGRTEDSDGEDDDSDEMSVDLIEEILPETVPWDPSGVRFPIWETIETSLPSTAIDGTDELAGAIELEERVAAIDGEEALTRTPARRRVFELADAMLAGQLPPVDRPFDDTILQEPAEASLTRRHSYTSLDTLAQCTRRHYLDYVVRAFDDPPSVEGTEEGPSQRVVGLVFHETAERAATEGVNSPDKWREIAERIATARGAVEAFESASACIDRFFQTEVAEWDWLEAERRFELTIDGQSVVGQIDLLARRPGGEPIVLDYKATAVERSIEEDLQLPIYLLAAADVFDEPVRTAGYVYVGEVGPKVVTREFTDADLGDARTRLEGQLQLAGQSNFADFTAGEHCRWCPHRSLPCSDEVI